jgi:hypothetical protein
MSFLTAAIPAVASSAASFGLSKLFGGDDKSPTENLKNFKPTGINAGGLSSSLEGDNLAITPSADRLGLVNRLALGFGSEADALSGLRGTVAPGASRIRSAFEQLGSTRLQQIEDARKAAIGNLRENMARRRVQGSSFGQDALTRAEIEFARAKEQASAETATQTAQTYLQELEATNQLIQQEFAARRGQFETGLNELNLQADVATKLAAGASQQLGANARLEAELSAKEQAAKGKFFGENVIGPVSKAFGDSFKGFKLPSFG